jgi:hypothetical protein
MINDAGKHEVNNRRRGDGIWRGFAALFVARPEGKLVPTFPGRAP